MTMPPNPPDAGAGGLLNPGGALGQVPGVLNAGAEGPGVLNAGAGFDSGAGAGLDSGVGLLAMTGAGPGTLLLALAGLASLVTGGFMALTGRRMTTRNTLTAGLSDLSHLAHSPG